MKHKFSITIRLAIVVAAMGTAGMALAQNPPLFPTPRPSASPAEKATVKSKSNITNNKEKGGSPSSADKAFIKDAAKGGMMEVAMGRVAEKNATNEDVKGFGARMVKDHSKANDELKAIAKEEGVELPGEPAAGKWKSDKNYMDAMVKDHEEDLAAFEKEAKNGSDPDVKRFASKTAATVRKHLEMAKEIDGKMK